MEKKLCVLLAFQIINLIETSGANEAEAMVAIETARALLPEAEIDKKPLATFQLG